MLSHQNGHRRFFTWSHLISQCNIVNCRGVDFASDCVAFVCESIGSLTAQQQIDTFAHWFHATGTSLPSFLIRVVVENNIRLTLLRAHIFAHSIDWRTPSTALTSIECTLIAKWIFDFFFLSFFVSTRYTIQRTAHYLLPLRFIWIDWMAVFGQTLACAFESLRFRIYAETEVESNYSISAIDAWKHLFDVIRCLFSFVLVFVFAIFCSAFIALIVFIENCVRCSCYVQETKIMSTSRRQKQKTEKPRKINNEERRDAMRKEQMKKKEEFGRRQNESQHWNAKNGQQK